MEIARLHAAQGGDLILVARTTSKLKVLREGLVDTYEVEVMTMPKDLSIPDAAHELYEAVMQEGIHVEYLFNVAGVAEYGPFHAADWDRTEMMMNVNMLALTQLTYLFGGDMLSEGYGGIVNVSSADDLQPPELLAVYNASKHFVEVFTEALAPVWQEQGVNLKAYCPPPADTNFYSTLHGPPAPNELESLQVVAKEAYESILAGPSSSATPDSGVLSKAMSWLPKGIRKGLARED